MNARPYVGAGATYARYLKNAFAVGPVLDNSAPFELPDGHGAVHQPDEILKIDGYLPAIVLLIKITLGVDARLQHNN